MFLMFVLVVHSKLVHIITKQYKMDELCIYICLSFHMYTHTYIMTEINEKLFLLISNFFFIAFPVSYLLFRVYFIRPINTYPIIHIVLCLFVSLISFVYHFCDRPFHETLSDQGIYYCIIPFHGLYTLDFQFSSITAINLLSYNLSGQDTIARECCILFLFTVNQFLYGLLNSYHHASYYIFTILISLALVGFRGFKRYQLGKTILPLDGDTKMGMACAVSFFVAFQFYYWGNVQDYYMIFHAMWHLFCSLGLLFGFIWIDTLSAPTANYTKVLDTIKDIDKETEKEKEKRHKKEEQSLLDVL